MSYADRVDTRIDAARRTGQAIASSTADCRVDTNAQWSASAQGNRACTVAGNARAPTR